MANYQKKKIQEMENSNFGKYQEGVGGGASPEPGDPSKHGHGVNSDHRKANNDTMQPRTDDGKFTYKSVNGESIDPKYGPSRGKTVNPLLTGGENGVMISDVEQQFYQQSGALWDKYKDKWYQKGSEYALMSQGKHHKADWTTRVAGDTIWNVGKRRYDKIKGEFVGESKVFKQSKKGTRTAEEEAARQKAQQTGEEQAVIEQSSGAIKLKPGTVIAPPVAPTPKPTSPRQGPIAPSPTGATQPTTSVNATNVSNISNADYTPKYSDDEISQARDILEQSGLSDSELADFDALSPKEKDKYIDKYFDTSVEEDQEETKQENSNGSEQTTEEDSEAIKKVKQMGFDDK